MANSLQAALDGSAVEATPKPVRTKLVAKTKAKKPSREGTVLVGAHFSPDVQKQLRMLAAEEGTTNRALIAEALNLLFRKKGKDAIL